MIENPDLRAATTDRSVLANDAYATNQYLGARQSLYRWQQPTYDLPGIVSDRLPPHLGLVVDVGCGDGRYINRIQDDHPDARTLGIDVSAGMLSHVSGSVAVADALQLPIVNHAAVAVLAMHMIYHLADIETGIAEMVRVLKTGGLLFASTNASDDKRELGQLWEASARDVLDSDDVPRRISLSDRFPLEEAREILGRYLTDVQTVELPGIIAVDTSEPVIAHLASYRSWAEQAKVPFDPTLERARQYVEESIKERGEFTVTCRSGIIIGVIP